MIIKMIGAIIIGAIILGVGLYYLIKERHDRDSVKIYEIISAVGGVFFAVMLVLTILALI